MNLATVANDDICLTFDIFFHIEARHHDKTLFCCIFRGVECYDALIKK